jgi:hypothetical protein
LVPYIVPPRLDPLCCSPPALAHLLPVLLDKVRLQVERRAEDDELALAAGRVRARVVRGGEVRLERGVCEEALRAVG